MMVFKALVGTKSDAGSDFSWIDLPEADLMDGDVLVRISHSTLNYKDGLAGAIRGRIVLTAP